jgi:hypothetical protein
MPSSRRMALAAALISTITGNIGEINDSIDYTKVHLIKDAYIA